MAVLALAVVSVMVMAAACAAQNAPPTTRLVDVRLGGSLSEKIAKTSQGGYRLAGGEWQDFSQWYTSRAPDFSITWISQFGSNVGIVWGLSTGESGEKFHIEPGLKLGFVAQRQVASDRYVSLSLTTVIGGRLKEQTCDADYGEIGGIQQVNCRLAASELPPVQTLQFLFNDRPEKDMQIRVSYVYNF